MYVFDSVSVDYVNNIKIPNSNKVKQGIKVKPYYMFAEEKRRRTFLR